MASVLGTADFSALANHSTMGWFPQQEPPGLAPERNGGGRALCRQDVCTHRKKEGVPPSGDRAGMWGLGCLCPVLHSLLC